ncbi:MAG: agmatinase, partial [Myxococcota bacterium]
RWTAEITMPQQSAFEYLSHGQTPFFRLPTVPFTTPDRAERYRGVDIVFLGVPYDGGTTYLPGARLGPYHIRRVSALVQTFHPGHRIDVFDRINAVDGGNAAVSPFDAEMERRSVNAEVSGVVASDAAPFLVGGDHTITLPALRAVAAKYGPVAVVHVDAHLDTSSPEVWGEPFHHGTPLRHALTEGLIAEGQLYQIGIRGAWGGGDDSALSEEHGARIISADVVETQGIDVIMAEIRQRIGTRPVYITFDIDGVDPAFAPGTGTPVPGGLSSREALRLIRALAGIHLVGMDLVEVAPNLDHADITCHLAAHLLFEGAALVALRAGAPSAGDPDKT